MKCSNIFVHVIGLHEPVWLLYVSTYFVAIISNIDVLQNQNLLAFKDLRLQESFSTCSVAPIFWSRRYAPMDFWKLCKVCRFYNLEYMIEKI